MPFIFHFKGLKKHSSLFFHIRFLSLLLIFFIRYQKTFWATVNFLITNDMLKNLYLTMVLPRKV